MNSQETALEEVRERLIKLETQNRRMKQVAAVALIAGASVLVMGQASHNTTVEANEFVVRDDSGTVRARLCMMPGGKLSEIPGLTLRPSPMLDLYDEQGHTSVLLSGAVGGAIAAESLFVRDSGHTLGSFSALRGYGELTISNPEGQAGALLKPGHLDISDDEGFKADLGIQELVRPHTGETHRTSAASLVLFDKDKNVIWKAP